MMLTDDEIDAMAEDLAERVEHWDPEVTIWNTNPDIARLAAQAREANALRAEVAQLRARLTPTLAEHDAHTARYWADRPLEVDDQGQRIPRLADCDWPKEHLRRALDALDEVRAAISIWPMTDDDWKRAHRILDAGGATRSRDRRADRSPSVASQILGMGVARFGTIEGETTREVATVGGEEETK